MMIKYKHINEKLHTNNKQEKKVLILIEDEYYTLQHLPTPTTETKAAILTNNNYEIKYLED